jgi:hypothetical protein
VQVPDSRTCDHFLDGTARPHASLVKHDKVVARGNFIDQVGRPEHAEPGVVYEAPNFGEDGTPGLHIEADRGLVEQ